MQEIVKPKVSVVVPCFDEAENLPILVDRIAGGFEQVPDTPFEAVIVDDGSRDETRTVLSRLAQDRTWLRPLYFERNCGQSAALITGMRAARGEYVLTMDGDLQNDPADFSKVLDLLERHDCVFGYRAVRKDGQIRKISSVVANCVRNAILRDGLRDTGCGLKGFRRKCVDAIVQFNGAHRFFGVFMRSAGFDIAQCPVGHHPRIHGRSKYGVHDRLWRGILDLFGVWWLRRRFVNPRVEVLDDTAGETGATADSRAEASAQ